MLNQQGNTVRYAGKMVFDKSGNLSRLINDTGHFKVPMDNGIQAHAVVFEEP